MTDLRRLARIALEEGTATGCPPPTENQTTIMTVEQVEYWSGQEYNPYTGKDGPDVWIGVTEDDNVGL